MFCSLQLQLSSSCATVVYSTDYKTMKRWHEIQEAILLALMFLQPLLIQFLTAQTLDKPRGPWRLVFKAVHGKKAAGFDAFWDLYTSQSAYNEGSVSQRQDFTISSEPFKSALLQDWVNYRLNVQAVKLSFFKGGEERQYIVFDGRGRTKEDWFDCTAILHSSYTDLPDTSLEEDCRGSSSTGFPLSVQKLSHLHAECNQTTGWTVVADSSLTFAPCSVYQPYRVTLPYFKYAIGSSKADLTTGLVYADSIGIFLQVYDMVFKGISGFSLSGSQDTLASLWAGDRTLNEDSTHLKTLTKPLSSQTSAYKSRVANAWAKYNIDMAKFSMFKNGKEMAHVTFSATNTDKNTWFSSDKALHSSFTDIDLSKQVCSIQGDEYRDWQIQERADNSDCTADFQLGWMLVREIDDQSTGCPWDQYTVLGHPYFLHSSSGLSQSPGIFDHADTMGVFVHGWRLVLKVTSGASLSPASSLYDLWINTFTLNEDVEGATSLAADTLTFKSSVVDQWSNHYIRAVKVAMYSAGTEVVSVVFDATGSTKKSWLACRRILYTSISDAVNIADAGHSDCSVDGDATNARRFFIGTSENCDRASGILTVLDVDDSQTGCQRSAALPQFVYSTSNAGSLSLPDSGTLEADVFAIFLDMESCDIETCQNGATGEEVAGHCVCFCIGDFYGDRCTDLDGAYSEWVSGGCSVSCGGGVDIQTRACDNPPAQGNGQCHGPSENHVVCNIQSCPVDGGFSAWTDWTSCTRTCGTGSRNRTRQCNSPEPQYGGADCDGELTESGDCNTQNCPVDGGWSAWSDWSTCSVTCSGSNQTRLRTCTSPAPQYGGSVCSGDANLTRTCNTDPCPAVNGAWSGWTVWSECSATCGSNGEQFRIRTCSNPAPEWGGDNCTGEGITTQDCNKFVCPIHGDWGNWSAWSDCTASCGPGYQSRSRSCDHPPPEFGGFDCQGNSTDHKSCDSPCAETSMQCEPDNPSECRMFFRNSACWRGTDGLLIVVVTVTLIVALESCWPR